jgi:imidazolonepropionase-like amidohydrolase
MLRRLLPLILLVLVCLPARSQNALVLEGAVVIDGVASRPLKNSIIVVDHGRISGFGPRNTVIIPPGAKRINLKGKYVIPGLIDGMVRNPSPSDLLRMLAWGVTSVAASYPTVDAALEAERWTAADSSRAPQVYAAAPIFTAPGGWTAEEGPDTTVNRFPATPDEARAMVRAVRMRGIRRIRIAYDAMTWSRDSMPRMAAEVMRALVEEAASQKLFTSVQAPRLADAREALGAGALSIAPGVLDEYLDASTVETILTRNNYYVPAFSSVGFVADPSGFMKRVFADKRFRASYPAATVKAWTSPTAWDEVRSAHPRGSYAGSQLPTMRTNVTTAVANYVLIVLGSDLPQLPGIAAHLELEEMVRAGMLTYQALISATTFGGQYLGAPKRVGTIEVGRNADLLVLDADPATDIRNTRSIGMVIKHGRVFQPKELLKAANR